MKLTKLFTGAAVAALMTAGAASAQVTIDSVTFGTGAGAVSSSTGTFWLASELNVSNAARTATLAFALDDSTPANGSTGWASGAAQLRIDFSGFLLNQSVAPADVVCTGGAATTVAAGGTPGDNFVVMNIADINACVNAGNAEVVVSGLDLLLTGSSANYTVTLTNTATGNPVDGNPVSHAGAAIPGSSATRGLVASRSIMDIGRTGSAGVWRANLPGYTTLTNTTATAVDAQARTDTFVDFASNTAGAVTIDYNVNIADAAGLNLAGITVGGATGTVTGSSIEFGSVSGASNAIVIPAATGSSAAAIREQTIAGTVDVNFTNSLLADISGAAVTYGSIIRQGQRSGLFEWVGDEGSSNESVFRMTGFSATAALPVIRATFQNETKDLATSEIILDTSTAGFSFSNGELVFSSRELGRQAGDYDRADVTFFFEGSVSPTIRRFVVANGNLEAFPGDFDQTCSATTGTVTNGAYTLTNGAYTVNGGSFDVANVTGIDYTSAAGTLDLPSTAITGATLTQAASTLTQAASTVSLNSFSCSQ